MNNGIKLFAIFVAIIVSGFVVSVGNYKTYDVETSVDEDVLNIVVNGMLPAEFSYSTYTNASVPDVLYFYYDEDLESKESAFKQNQFFNSLKSLLEIRGFTNIEYLNAIELAEFCFTDSLPEKHMIVFASSSLPYTIFTDDDLLKSWIMAGGRIVWSGEVIGSYISYENEIVEGDPFSYFPEGAISMEDQEPAFIDSEWSQHFGLSFTICDVGLHKDYADMLFGTNNDAGYSSMASMKYGLGEILVTGASFSSNIETKGYMILADIIVGGIHYGTTIYDEGQYTKSFGRCVINVVVPSTFTIRMTIGEPYVSWGKTVSF